MEIVRKSRQKPILMNTKSNHIPFELLENAVWILCFNNYNLFNFLILEAYDTMSYKKEIQ